MICIKTKPPKNTQRETESERQREREGHTEICYKSKRKCVECFRIDSEQTWKSIGKTYVGLIKIMIDWISRSGGGEIGGVGTHMLFKQRYLYLICDKRLTRSNSVSIYIETTASSGYDAKKLISQMP